MSETLPVRRRFGYGVGDFAFNLFFTTASLYLLYFYTDVLGLPPQTAGWIFAAPLIWDAISDPIMGYFASRTRTRWGRYRPYILFGAIPLAISWAAMFLPTGLTGSALVLYALATHMVFRTLYTVVSMPYLSLSAVMTSSSHERGVLASFRMMAATSAGLFVALTTLTLATRFGGGNEGYGFFVIMSLYATLAAAILLFVFSQTEERVATVAPGADDMRAMARMIRRNTPFWLIGGMLLFASMASTIFGKTLPYVLKYEFDRSDLIGPALGAIAFFAMVSIPLWTWVMKRTSKRAVALAGISANGLGWLGFLLLVGTDVTNLFVCMAVLGIGGGASALTFWAMIPDTVEFGEYRSGVRAEGMVFGFISFLQKAALGLAVGLLGELLGLIGYRANVAQSPETLADMRLLMTLAPLSCAIVAGAFVWLYPLDRQTHGRLVRVLDDRVRRNLQRAPVTVSKGIVA